MMNAPAYATEPQARPSRARKVLVAEDSAITHDLLKLLLNQRGHEVDVVTDGVQALEALRNKHYDVALLDYHLPNLDGLQVASTIKAEAQGGQLPRLIAITADPEGLLKAKAGCEEFDQILPKPLDINQVGELVEEQAELADSKAGAAEPAVESPTAQMPIARIPSVLDGMERAFLEWPEDLDASRFTSRAMQASLGDPRFDALVVRVPVSVEEFATVWDHKALCVLPVIDLNGSLGRKADLDASKLEPRERGQVDRLIRRFQDKRLRLHRDLVLSEDLEDRLLGRILVSGHPLTATFDPSSPSCVSYNAILDSDTIARLSESLCRKALLKRKFVERFHVCGRCDSSRIHVRDVCVKCSSSNLTVEEYLHHFRCGFQGLKSEFRRGLQFVCPKCRRQIGEINTDYEPVARLVICQSCGHADPKSAIGMVCLDCGGHCDWGTCAGRDYFSYQLTSQGIGFTEYGRSFLGLFQKPLRFEELPRELMLALNDAAKKYNEDKSPFALVNIFYRNERALTSEHGARQFAEARAQFVDNLRTAFGSEDMVVKGPSSYDFALLPGVDPGEVTRSFNNLRERAASSLPFDLGATLKAFGPKDF